MAYDNDMQYVRVKDEHRAAVHECFEALMREADKLSGLISDSLSRDRIDLSGGFSMSINTTPPDVDTPPLGVGVAIMCNPSTGECIGVMDDYLGVSRPCSESDAAHCLQCSVAPTDPEVLKNI